MKIQELIDKLNEVEDKENDVMIFHGGFYRDVKEVNINDSHEPYDDTLFDIVGLYF